MALTVDRDCAVAIADLVRALVFGDVIDATYGLLSSAALVIIFKKIEEEMADLRAAKGDAYLQPHRPMGMGGTITKLAAIYDRSLVEVAVWAAAGPRQFAINTKGGCDMV